MHNVSHASDSSVEAQLQALRQSAPRVTPEEVKREIVRVHFFTALEGAEGRDVENPERTSTSLYRSPDAEDPLGLLTICVLVLRNGYTVVGTAGVVSRANFVESIGRTVAYDNAVSQIWPLLGYQLRQKISKAPP